MKLWRAAFFGVFLALSIGVCVCAYVFGGSISFAVQWPLFEALRNTAAIVFAVVGAWLAIIYPERLKSTLRPASKSGEGPGQAPNMSLLLTPAVSSAAILVIVLGVGILAPLAKQIPVALQYVPQLRSLTFTLLVALTIWQIVIVVLSILPVDFLLTDESERRSITQVNEHYGSLAQRANKG